MNITVNKLFDIWGDLDSSYEKYKSKLNVSSKSEYIKKLCLDKNGNELFTKTKTILSKEVDSLDNEEDQRKLDYTAVTRAQDYIIIVTE